MRLLLAFALLLALPASATAGQHFVTLRDDGTVVGNAFATGDDVAAVTDAIVARYTETGLPLPDVLSVWTSFPLHGSALPTFFAPVGSTLEGVGLEAVYHGTFESPYPPLASVLFHNDVTQLAARAQKHRVPAGNELAYAQYLFLLELSHNWGPEVRLPTKDKSLLGFDFHWSFYLDAGRSPSGGNAWHDNGDGTFTTESQSPAAVQFTPLDLYLMGLVPATKVPPFGLLESVVPPTGVTDPLNGGKVKAATFPWFDAAPLRVAATRRTITIDEIVAENGARVPAFGDAPTTWRVGVVLLVPGDASDESIATAAAVLEPLAASLPATFAAATGQKGTLELVVPQTTAPPDGGTSPAQHEGGGCTAAGESAAPLSACLAVAALLSSRRRRTRRCSA